MTDSRLTLDMLEDRIVAILPELYQESYEDLQPVSMGSAGLKYGADGRVAWDEIWDSFCDLAMAGGPPHKGSLLEPGTRPAIEAEPARYGDVIAEICRGITMVTGCSAVPSPVPGWVRISGGGPGMAEWLLRAIVMENVSARCDGTALDLPAAPHFRIDKEVKNVVTVMAKTFHYWSGHMWALQRQAIAQLFVKMEAEASLIEPSFETDGSPDTAGAVAESILRYTGLRRAGPPYGGWLGVECSAVGAAVWMMRALVACNVLARREGTVLFVPLNSETDPGGAEVTHRLARVRAFAVERGVL